MEDGFRIERYRSSDRDLVFELMRASFPHAVADRMIEQWDWKYDSNPFNAEAKRERVVNRRGIAPFIRSVANAEDLAYLERCDAQGSPFRDSDPYCLLIRNDHAVAGLVAAIPQLYMIGGVEHWVGVTSDFAVHPGYRRNHLSARLVQTIKADIALRVSWPNDLGRRAVASVNRTIRGYASDPKVAWVAVEKRIPILVKPIDWRAVANHASRNLLVKRAAELLGPGIDGLREKLMAPAPARGVAIHQVSSFDDRIDKFWEKARKYYPVMSVRNRRHLTWRFVARPDTSYTKLIAVEGSDLVGYMVCRTAERDGMRYGYIVDFLTDDESPHLLALLLNAAERRMVGDGAKVICIIAPRNYRLWRQGYFPGPPATRPTFGVRLGTADPILRIFTDMQQWFLTMAEGDLDYNL